MTAANYDNCLAITLDYEGGYSNDRGDPGGPTKYGITIHDVRQYINPRATAADVRALTLAQAKAIYRAHYWNPVAGDAWPDGLDLGVFDAGVNSGVGRALQWARSVLLLNDGTFFALAARVRGMSVEGIVSLIKDYSAKRLSFLHALRTWSIFGRGWGHRVAGIEALGVKMALKASGMPSPEIGKKLGHEGDAAKRKSKQHGGAAAGGGAAGGGAATQVDWTQVPHLLTGLVVVLAIAAFVYFIWWSSHHNARAQAYADAAKSV